MTFASTYDVSLIQGSRAPEVYHLPGGSEKQDVAQEAYDEAVKYLKKELSDDKKAQSWLDARTTIDEVQKLASDAEKKYLDSSSEKRIMQKWLRSLSSRVQYYGQALDVMAQHHPEYLSLAWGTMKFVFTGILNHEKLVTELSKAIGEIGEVLPRVKVTATLYRTDQMRDTIANLYAHILLFLKQAVKWYRLGPAGRAISAIFKPFELSYKDTIEQIKLCTKTVEDLANQAQRAEIRDMHVIVQQLTRGLFEMQNRFDVFQSEILKQVGFVLQVATRNKVLTEEMQIDVRDIKPRVVDMHFNDVMSLLKPRRLPQDSLHKQKSLVKRGSRGDGLRDDLVFLIKRVDEWISSPNSSLFVLQSGPRAEKRAKEIVLNLISALQPTAAKVVWYLSGPVTDDQNTPSLTELLKSLVYQIVQLDTFILKNKLDTITAAKLHSQLTEMEWLDLLCMVLQQMPKCFIMVEAEDVYKATKERQGSSEMFLRVFQTMLNRASDYEIAVKLLIVSYGAVQQNCLPRNSIVMPVKQSIPVTQRLRNKGIGKMSATSKWQKLGRSVW